MRMSLLHIIVKILENGLLLISYTALKPAWLTELSDLKRIQRTLAVDKMGAGRVEPQYFPMSGSDSAEPSRT